MSMAGKSRGAGDWHIFRSGGRIAADIVRVTPSHVLQTPTGSLKGERGFSYRLALDCDSASGEGDIILSWSPVPANGIPLASVDGGMPLEYVLDEQEAMANGDPGSSRQSSVVLAGSARSDDHPVLSVPLENLQINGPVGNEQIEFPFADLHDSDRELLNNCFTGRG